MDAYIASVPVHLLYAMQMIKQNRIGNCDLYYVPTTNNVEEFLESVRRASVFNNVYLLPNINIEYPITISQCIKIAWNRFGARDVLKMKEYDTVYYNTDGWLLNSIVFSSMKNKNTRNVFVENGVNPYITSYDNKEWYLRLFINCNFMTCMDGRFINDRFVFEPPLISVHQSGSINRIDKIDRNDSAFKDLVNAIFDYDDQKDSFRNKRVIIMEQAPRREPIDMVSLWTRVSALLDRDKTIIKSHPRQKNSILKGLGFDVYERYQIPWEVLSFNQDIDDKTLITIFSTSCVNPKLMFNEEPRVIMLYKLLGIDYSFFGEGLINFVEGVGNLYNDKDKFFVPESWEALEAYCRKYNLKN